MNPAGGFELRIAGGGRGRELVKRYRPAGATSPRVIGEMTDFRSREIPEAWLIFS